ncbi:FISUMP domain-containing protein [Sphingobacterium kitahiroshimense]|uniref:FISUMP domain-containing protein n=1 Tax=Sphingobacterium kitahiroshimense TaxID=470446 RepID=A0ABV0BWI0_9SPHI
METKTNRSRLSVSSTFALLALFSGSIVSCGKTTDNLTLQSPDLTKQGSDDTENFLDDSYLTHFGLPAARINGKIWMRHNLGVNTNLDPDALPMTTARHGNYYQWGKQVVNATGAAKQQSNYNTMVPHDKSWNAGTEQAPLKATADPCPSGYRIPTATEVKNLISSVKTLAEGRWASNSENYEANTVLISKSNPAVKLTIPTQGMFNFNNKLEPSSIINRGKTNYFWTSTVFGGRVRGFQSLQSGSATVYTVNTSGYDSKLVSFNVRCIAI